MISSTAETIIIKGGRIVKKHKNGVNYILTNEDILISNGKIVNMQENISMSENEGVGVINLSRDDIIFPGLIDLHTHHEYNMMPLWDKISLDKPWDNRFQWRVTDDYKKDIKDTLDKIKRKWDNETLDGIRYGDLFIYFSQVQAISGGTTVIQEPFDIDDDPILDMKLKNFDRPNKHILIRSSGVASDLGFNEKDKVYSIVDFFNPYTKENKYDPKKWDNEPHMTNDYKIFLENLKSESDDYNMKYLVHLSEGRAGNLKKESDGYSKKEFKKLKEDILNQDKFSNVKESNLSLIHACAIDLSDEENIKFLEERKIGLVWSPVSNLLLYADTPDFYNKLISNENIKIALGSDWSPSGSKHVWDEAKFAYKYLLKHTNPKYKSIIRDKIIDMVTINPATLLGAEKNLGSIEKGKFADFFILNSNHNCHPGELLIRSNDSNVSMVMCNGNILYLDKEIINKNPAYFNKDKYNRLPASEGSIGKSKYVYLDPSLGIDFNKGITELEEVLGSKRSRFLSSADNDYINRIESLEKHYI